MSHPNARIVLLESIKVPRANLLAAFALLALLARRVTLPTLLVALVLTPLPLARKTSVLTVNPERSLWARATSFVPTAMPEPISQLKGYLRAWDVQKAKLPRKVRPSA